MATGAELYDQQVEHARHLSILPAGTVINLPFITPPTTALLALPFTALNPGTAYRVWSLLELVVLALAVWIAIRAGPWPAGRESGRGTAVLLLALAGGGTYAFLLLGQIDGITALGLAAAYAAWRRDRSVRAGFWLGLAFAATKPHLAIGLGVWLLARRDWRALAGAATGCVLVAVVSFALIGPSGVGGFVSALGFAYGNTPGASTVGIPGLVASWLGTGTLPSTLGVIGSLGALAGCAILGARSRGGSIALEVSLAGAAALSLAASPHLLSHDIVILAPVFAWCAARAAAADAARWPGMATLRVAGAWAILGLAAFIDTGNAAPAPPGRLVPLALIGIGAAALVITGSRSPAGGPALVALAQSGSGRGAGGSTA